MITAEQLESLTVEKYFWMVTEDKYEKLRTINGCEELTDLRATVTDGEHIINIANQIGVPDENRYIDISPTLADLKNTYKLLLKLTRAKSMAGIPHILFVYLGGHGATQNEK